MTPKEKAEELVKKYRNPFNRKGCIPPSESMFPSTAKQCALIAVDEILNNKELLNHLDYEWWKQVKHEIEKL